MRLARMTEWYRIIWRTLYEDCCEVRTHIKCHCVMRSEWVTAGCLAIVVCRCAGCRVVVNTSVSQHDSNRSPTTADGAWKIGLLRRWRDAISRRRRARIRVCRSRELGL